MAWVLQRRLTLRPGNAFFTPQCPPELPPIGQASPTDTCLPRSTQSTQPRKRAGSYFPPATNNPQTLCHFEKASLSISRNALPLVLSSRST